MSRLQRASRGGYCGLPPGRQFLGRNMRIKASGRLLPVLLALVAVAVTVSVTSASADEHHKADHVTSKTDAAVEAKLSPDLQQQVQDDSTAPVKIVVSLQSDSVGVAQPLLSDSHVASKNGSALMVG